MTKVRIEKTTADDLFQIFPRSLHEVPVTLLNEENAKNIESHPYINSIVDVFGRVWGIGGFTENEPGVWETWFIVDKEAKSKLFSIVKILKHCLAAHPALVIEAWIDVNFDGGHKWITMLGFKEWVPRTVQNRQGPNCVKYILDKREP